VRKEFQFVVVLTLAAIAAGMATVAAPEYLPALREYPGLIFWSGLAVTVALIAIAIAIAVRADALETQSGHGRRMIALTGMILCGIGFFVFFGVYFWPAAVREPQTATVAPAPVVRGPTLEATGGSTIDATGATMPGDLPFQFAKADDNSVIDMPGITVTKQPDGTITVTPGNASRQFPAPNGDFTMLSNVDLIAREESFCKELRAFQERFSADLQKFSTTGNKQADDTAFKDLTAPYFSEYKSKYSSTALSLASEFLSRLGTVTVPSMSARSGGGLVLHQAFAGPTPASDVADFLDALGQRLPVQ
jgi:hypothetical protein